MKVEDVVELWIQDSKVDDVLLDQESLNIPNLHSKYLALLSKERLNLNLHKIKLDKLKATLTDYFKGNLNDPVSLKKLNRPPQSLRILRDDISTYVNNDEEVSNLLINISYREEVVKLLEEILKNINNRNFVIRNAIEWRKLTQFGTV